MDGLAAQILARFEARAEQIGSLSAGPHPL
jgi:hypothetical protein